MRINFYFDKRFDKKQKGKKVIRLDKKGNLGIHMFIHFEGKRFKHYTGEKISPEYWDYEKQRAKEGTPGAEELNHYLDSLAAEVDSVYRRARTLRIPVSIEYLKDNLTFIRKRELSYLEIFDKFIDTEKNLSSWAIGTIKAFGVLKNHLQAINKIYKLEFSSINDNFLQAFIKYYNSKEFTNTFITKQFKLVKWFMNWATLKKYNTYTDYQGFRLKLKMPKEDDNIIFLTIDELQNLYSLKIESESLAKVRDIFCFGCLTGLRYGDLQNLKKTDVKNGSINITTLKTGRKLDIPLTQWAKAILKRYENYPGLNALPVISNQKYNAHLKDLGELAELNELVTIIEWRGNERTEIPRPKKALLTTHVARKTFITSGVYFDIPITTIIALTGQTLDVVQRYYKVQNKTKVKAMSKWNKLRIA